MNRYDGTSESDRHVSHLSLGDPWILDTSWCYPGHKRAKVVKVIDMTNESSMVVVKSENKELYTSAELAEKFGMSKSNMDARLRKLGVKPEVEAVPGPTGKPALYNLETLIRIEEEEEEAIRIKKEQALIEKHVDALKPKERTTVMQQYIERLKDDFSHEATRELMA